MSNNTLSFINPDGGLDVGVGVGPEAWNDGGRGEFMAECNGCTQQDWINNITGMNLPGGGGGGSGYSGGLGVSFQNWGSFNSGNLGYIDQKNWSSMYDKLHIDDPVFQNTRLVFAYSLTRYTRVGAHRDYMQAWEATDYEWYVTEGINGSDYFVSKGLTYHASESLVHGAHGAFMNHPVTQALMWGMASVVTVGLSTTYLATVGTVTNTVKNIENVSNAGVDDFVESYSTPVYPQSRAPVGGTYHSNGSFYKGGQLMPMPRLHHGVGSGWTPSPYVPNQVNTVGIPRWIQVGAGLGLGGALGKRIYDQNKRIEHKGIHSH